MRLPYPFNSLFLLAVLLPVPLLAQPVPTRNGESISVETLVGRVIASPGEPILPELVVVTLSHVSSGLQRSKMVERGGRFEFEQIVAGNYLVTVSSPGYEAVEERVLVVRAISKEITQMYINMGRRLAEDKPSTPASDREVSVDELKIPSKALKELEKAGKAGDRGDSGLAIRHLHKAIDIFPSFHQAYNNLGVQLLRQGRRDEAFQAWRRSLEIQPENSMALRNLGLMLLGSDRPDSAIDYLVQATELDIGDQAARMALGQAYYRTDRFEEARTVFNELAASRPENAGAQLGLGYAALQSGRLAEALKAFHSFLELEPNGIRAEDVRVIVAQLVERIRG